MAGLMAVTMPRPADNPRPPRVPGRWSGDRPGYPGARSPRAPGGEPGRGPSWLVRPFPGGGRHGPGDPWQARLGGPGCLVNAACG